MFSRFSTLIQLRNYNYLSFVLSFRRLDSVADVCGLTVQDSTYEGRRSIVSSSADSIRYQHPIQLYESSFVEEEEGQEDGEKDQEGRWRQHSDYERYQSARHEQFRSLRVLGSLLSFLQPCLDD